LAGQFVFVDGKSTNGSFINGERVTAARQLADGDRITLGQTMVLKFSFLDEVEKLALVRVYEAAFRDALTGVFNRKYLEERLDSELAFANRHGTELSVIMMDLDHFKRVNDTHGHLAGDEVIKSSASLFVHSVRADDLVARYGGEEFLIIVRGVPVAGAAALAERARRAIAETVVPFAGIDLRVTVSSGVASLQCCGAKRDKAALLSLSDSRLYQAKQGGRNRVVGPQ
jgi:two-component system cell cycle response regulator